MYFPPSASCKHLFPFHLVGFRGALMHRLSEYWSFIIVTFLLLLAWKPSAAVAALCLSNQSTALLRFKQGLSLPGTGSLISWREGSDCCNWEGVICERATGYVIRLQLRGATLKAGNSSRLDPSLFHLSRLRVLDLSENLFHGPIPSRLVELRELAHLNLSNAGFRGQIPLGLSHMRSLVSLDLSVGWYGYVLQLRQLELGNIHLSALLGNLNRLRTLHLNGINISMNGADCISIISSALPNLQELSLSGCSISGPMNESILQLKWLSYLDLSGNHLSSIPECFGNLTSLRYLDLCGNDLSSIPECFGNLTSLRYLDLSGNDLSSIPQCRWNLTALRYLNLSRNDLSSIPQCRWNLTALRYLDLSRNDLSSIPECLWNLTALRFLSLSYCSLRGTVPSALFMFPHLESLHVSSNPDLQGSFPARLPLGGKLQVLKLSSTGLGGSIPDSIGNLSQLRVIDMSNCSFTGSIPLLLSKLTRLQSIDLSHNSLSGPIPSFFASTITEIDLSSNAFSGPIPESFGELDGLEILSLEDNLLNGWIPLVLLNLPSLKEVHLGNNGLTGPFSQFTNASSLLKIIDLRNNSLTGEIPTTITSLPRLFWIDLSFNHFSGTINISLFMGMKNLWKLDLSENRLTVVDGPSRHDQGEVGLLTELYLSSCNIHKFPEGICNQGGLSFLDLSNNNISGLVPSCLWGMFDLRYLNLSHNMLTTLGRPSDVGNTTSSFFVPYQNPLAKIWVLDISFNRLTSLTNISSPPFLYLSTSNNKIGGTIPEHFCNSPSLLVFVDLSNNGLVGSIPSCLTSSVDRSVLDLSKNQLEGQIPDAFGVNCSLETLKLNGNRLSGTVPFSLSKCQALDVLDLSNNELTGEFPSWLGGLRRLRLLSMSSNNFYGSLVPPPYEKPFPVLQILDVSSNNLGGTLDPRLFRLLSGMIKREPNGHQADFKGNNNRLSSWEDKDGVPMIIKGRVAQMTRMLDFMTSMDLSDNHFTGEIPNEIGTLNGLILLNMSNNHLIGQMPQSLANLLQLQSLDLSRNNLSGNIPAALTKLTFLSVLNLSFNNLQGRIPQGNQLSTFEAPSFEGNPGLCGPPLTRTCPDTAPPPKLIVASNPKTDLGPLFIAAELGLIVGLASVLMPVFLVRRVRWWWFRLVDTTIEVVLLRRLHLHSCIFFG